MKRYLIGILALNLAVATPLSSSSLSRAFAQLENGMQQMMDEVNKDDIHAERTKNDIIISVQKPDINLNLKVTTNRVEYTIKEEIIKEELDNESKVVSRQSSISHQSFSQSLPSKVSLDEISIHYEEGTLWVSLPKIQKDSEKTRIPITVK